MTQQSPSDTPPAGIGALFAPRSIAILGASSDPDKIGGVPVALLKRSGFAGRILPVNPRSPEIQGLPAWPTLADVPGEIDLAIVALNAAVVPGAVDDCLARGVRAIVMFSAGLGEVDAEGRAVQAAIAARCRAAGVPLLGPNSLGLFSPASGVFATFSASLEATWPRAGNIAIASQSGAVGSYAYAMLHGRGLGISHFIATGNEADVDVAACIDWLADDRETEVILGYVEGTGDGPALRRALVKATAAGKRVIMMKVGTSSAGAAAVASHTGAIAGASSAYDAVFAEAGVLRANSMADLVDMAEAASLGVLPRGRRLGILTPSGGIGVLLADTAAEYGFDTPELPAAAQAEILDLIRFASARNPVDVTAQVVNDMTLLPRITGIMVEKGDYDVLVFFLAHMGRNQRIMDALVPPLAALRARHPDRLFIICTLHDADMRDRLRAAGFLTCSEPLDAVRAASALVRLGEGGAPAPVAPQAPRIVLPAGTIDEATAKALLAPAGIPFPPERTCPDVDSAVAAAGSLGYPVAMKVLSADIAHKSDVGGVRLNLGSEDELRKAHREMLAAVAAAAPAARIEGVLVSPMLSGGVETVIGAWRDPVFGPMLMLGLGGIHVELLRDVVFRPAPVSAETAWGMVHALRSAPLLTRGLRGRPPADIDALVRVLVRVSEIAAANADHLDGLELNPFLALPEGGVALDALISPRTEDDR